jgi:hypothetical protein
MTRGLAALLAAMGGACGAHPAAPVASSVTFATAVRAPVAGEPSLEGVSLDPALDCVARKVGAGRASQRALIEDALACGSPLYVLDARVVASAQIESAVADLRMLLAPSIPVAVGLAHRDQSVTVVVAARTVELEPFHPGDRELRGRLLVPVAHPTSFVSTARGVVRRSVAHTANGFAVDISSLGDADVELAIHVNHDDGPLARVRLGAGSPLFAGTGTLLERTNRARAVLGLGPLRFASPLHDCSQVESTVADEDVTDIAHCHNFPRLPAADIAVAVEHSAMTQALLVGPRSSLLEVGELDGRGFAPAGSDAEGRRGSVDGAMLRVLERFEVMTPDAGRAHVIAALRKRWPGLVERPAPAGKLDELLAQWIVTKDYRHSPEFANEIVTRLAQGWSNAPRYATLLETSRDLDTIIEDVRADAPPISVDVAFAQTRGPNGELRNLVAVILAVP